MLPVPAFAFSLVSALWLAQAEPAPLAPVSAGKAPRTLPSPPVASQAPPPKSQVSVIVRGSRRLADDIGPALGFSFAMAGEHRYATVLRQLELSLGADFSYTLHRKDVVGATDNPGGGETTFDTERTISDNQFVLLQSAAVNVAGVRVFAALGPGLALGYFSSAERALRPGEQRSLRPIARAAIGVERNVSADVFVGVRLDYSATLSTPTYTATSGQRLQIFGDLLALGFMLGNRFP